jgi:beta-glucanase (GH16 family)
MHVDRKKLEQRHQVGGAPNEVLRGFHTYAFELMPTYAAVYVDDVRVQYITPETYPDLWNEAYFGSPFHMRLNLHIGTSAAYWGIPDPAHKEWTQSLDYKVDYVRTWEYTPAQ